MVSSDPTWRARSTVWVASNSAASSVLLLEQHVLEAESSRAGSGPPRSAARAAARGADRRRAPAHLAREHHRAGVPPPIRTRTEPSTAAACSDSRARGENHVGAAVVAGHHQERDRTRKFTTARAISRRTRAGACASTPESRRSPEVRQHHDGRFPLAALSARPPSSRRAETACRRPVRAVGRMFAAARQAAALDPDQTDRRAAERRVPHDRRLGTAPMPPALERRLVLVHQRAHQRTHREGPLALRVVLAVVDLADALELALALAFDRGVGDVALVRVFVARLRGTGSPDRYCSGSAVRQAWRPTGCAVVLRSPFGPITRS